MERKIEKGQLYSICSKFRNAIIEVKKENGFHRKSLLYNFPRGCCGVTTSLLRYYLRELGINTREYGCDYRDGTHEFLMYNNWIIDLTADQFIGENRPAVYVDEPDDFYDSMESIEEYDFFDFKKAAEQERWDKLNNPHAINVYDYNAIIDKLVY